MLKYKDPVKYRHWIVSIHRLSLHSSAQDVVNFIIKYLKSIMYHCHCIWLQFIYSHYQLFLETERMGVNLNCPLIFKGERKMNYLYSYKYVLCILFRDKNNQVVDSYQRLRFLRNYVLRRDPHYIIPTVYEFLNLIIFLLKTRKIFKKN